jgi:hypothetical protein
VQAVVMLVATTGATKGFGSLLFRNGGESLENSKRGGQENNHQAPRKLVVHFTIVIVTCVRRVLFCELLSQVVFCISDLDVDSSARSEPDDGISVSPVYSTMYHLPVLFTVQ